MPSKSFFFSIVVLSIIIAMMVVFFVKINSIDKVVYVDNEKLFNDFKMTKELKHIGEKTLLLQKTQIDSLKVLLSTKISEDEKSLLLKQIISKQQLMDEYEQTFIRDNSKKIWERISSYSKDFAEKNDYKLIIGSQFKSDIIYGSTDIDVTEMMLDFINKKYEGL